MSEVKVKEGEELNGLGVVLQQTIDKNLQDPKKQKGIVKLKGTIVVKESDADTAVTIDFRHGDIQIQNGAIDKPAAYLESTFLNLASINSGQVGPIMALLTGKIKVRGNLLKLLQMSSAIITKE